MQAHTTNIDEAREQVTKIVLSARTLPQIEAAKQVLHDWIEAHADEQGMRDGFEQLYTIQEIIEDEAARRAAGEIIPPVRSERDRILDQARDARSEDQSQWAAYELWEWLHRNPADAEVRAEFERFSFVLDIAEEQKAERTQAKREPIAAK